MDKVQLETDKICMTTAGIFRAMDALEQQRKELDRKLVEQMQAYSNTAKVWGWSREHMRRACAARGFLL